MTDAERYAEQARWRAERSAAIARHPLPRPTLSAREVNDELTMAYDIHLAIDPHDTGRDGLPEWENW
jgi:hypothetical protein